jgi:hypothetical protein
MIVQEAQAHARAHAHNSCGLQSCLLTVIRSSDRSGCETMTPFAVAILEMQAKKQTRGRSNFHTGESRTSFGRVKKLGLAARESHAALVAFCNTPSPILTLVKLPQLNTARVLVVTESPPAFPHGRHVSLLAFASSCHGPWCVRRLEKLSVIKSKSPFLTSKPSWWPRSFNFTFSLVSTSSWQFAMRPVCKA